MEETRDLFEIENRMKNLLWTVSGDYTLEAKLNVEAFVHSKYSALYDAIKQGAMAKFFSMDEYSMYLIKKLYYGADETGLMRVSSLCIDMACAEKISVERQGVKNIRKRAYEEILEKDFANMQADGKLGKLRFSMLRRELDPSYRVEAKVEKHLEKLQALKNTNSTMDVIRVVDHIYNTCIDPTFVKEHGDLEKVLAVTLDELQEFNWQDFLNEDVLENMLEKMQNQVTENMTELSEDNKEKKRTGAGRIILNEKALEKMHSYIEWNYGKSYLTELEQKQLNHQLCYGAHKGCTIYMTEGILKNPVAVNNTYVLVNRSKQMNFDTYRQHANVTKRNIEILEATLTRALRARSEKEYVPAQYGLLRPERLWKIGRTKEYQVFDKETKKQNEDFVVELLIDASGSQQKRQNFVALQSFVVSSALSRVGIPHRAMSFCTFWDYTILHRFRDYEDKADADWNLFEFRGSSNNRDGLAIRMATESLMKREEPNKVLIVLSDGRPNDQNVNRPNAPDAPLYTGDYAVKDTAIEVRRARSLGIAVLGVFMGEEQDLGAERKIFGKDFAYIKNIANFSNVVGTYLRKQLEE
ncbi:MAG: VWA domain-containing protein [Lachnospiraceae bacterium]|nr:VWA domain-containing protein [Lachnospiraceae bacterium]